MAEKTSVARRQLIILPGLFLSGFLTSAAALPLLLQQRDTFELANTGIANTMMSLSSELAKIAGNNSIALIAFAVAALMLLFASKFIFSGSPSAAAPVVEAQPIEKNAKIEAAGTKLSDELTEVLCIIEDYVGANDRYSASLEKARENLPRRVSAEQVRQVVRSLVEENQSFQKHSEELRTSLNHSKQQIEALRSELSEAQQEGLRDALTQIGNRRLFDKTLVAEVDKAKLTSGDLTLVLSDIDHFKKFNDTYGHQVGDEVLKVFAKLMSTNTKGQDTVARYGGEEFAIILPQTDAGNAYQLVEQIRRKLENKQHEIKATGERVSKLTASFGIAKCRMDDTAETLVARADAKLYQAKGNGRNCIVVDNSTPD